MDIALGEIFTGVFSVCSCSVSNSFDVIQIANCCRLRTSSGTILKQQELLNMIVSGVCLLMMNTVLKFILQTQISKTSALPFFWVIDELDYWLEYYYRLAENQEGAALPLFSWNLLQKVSNLRMVRNLLWNGLILTMLALWRYVFSFHGNALVGSSDLFVYETTVY